MCLRATEEIIMLVKGDLNERFGCGDREPSRNTEASDEEKQMDFGYDWETMGVKDMAHGLDLGCRPLSSGVACGSPCTQYME